ncbi:MAG: S-adenosylmethionine:tRNA ribosyltransferase-isomerase, partial [Bacteroidales bacterium]|nr:S-adenosylmethionine:tRNA ribosyltransferase-isomerase [Bacteroidales bacterium]
GETPLPKIHRRKVVPEDEERYQTIYAKREGAVAAPTAGFHFSRELMKRLELAGVDFAEITLHAGLGNFRDIEVEDLTKHKMDSEEMEITQMQTEIVNRAKENKKKVCAIGTTSMKALETAVSITGKVKPYNGWSNKFIFPPYKFGIADAMVTNFHLPMSSVLMMVAAFGGYELIMDAYKVAIEEKYKFFTFGDAMLVI